MKRSPTAAARTRARAPTLPASPAMALPDQLARLPQRTQFHLGAPFEPDTLRALVDLQADDRPTFEMLRWQLKQHTDCRVTELDAAIDAAGGAKRPTQADVLLRVANGVVELSHTAEGCGMARIRVGRRCEVLPIAGRRFRLSLTHLYFGETGRAPHPEALDTAIGALEARALFDSAQLAVAGSTSLSGHDDVAIGPETEHDPPAKSEPPREHSPLNQKDRV